jgi:putative ABC transport system ATP-binding protein
MSDPFAIETRQLNKVYGSGRTEVVALRQATLQVPKGKVVALLGPSVGFTADG